MVQTKSGARVLVKRLERVINCCLSCRILTIEAVVAFEVKEIEKRKRENFEYWLNLDKKIVYKIVLGTFSKESPPQNWICSVDADASLAILNDWKS